MKIIRDRVKSTKVEVRERMAGEEKGVGVCGWVASGLGGRGRKKLKQGLKFMQVNIMHLFSPVFCLATAETAGPPGSPGE